MKYWDEELFPAMLATIRGEKYLLMSESQINDELNQLAFRAIAAFKFPKISLAYNYEIIPDTEEKRYYFIADTTFEETSILIAWMKYF
jgi:hypothetical protein